jgi:hypothetical protein
LPLRDNVYGVTTPTTADTVRGFARLGVALAGQYELECEIGRGGMGIVYLARDESIDYAKLRLTR